MPPLRIAVLTIYTAIHLSMYTIVNTNPITHDAFEIYIRTLITLFSRLYLLHTIETQSIHYPSHTQYLNNTLLYL